MQDSEHQPSDVHSVESSSKPAAALGHTPGPWVVRPRYSVDGYFKVELLDDYGYTCYRVAHVIDGNDYAQNAFNADLIAAAPELLAAVEDLLAGWKYIRGFHGDLYGVGWDRAQAKAETALAKAKSQVAAAQTTAQPDVQGDAK